MASQTMSYNDIIILYKYVKKSKGGMNLVKKKKIISLVVTCMALFLMTGFDSYASEISGEQTISQEEVQNGQTEHSDEITVMDEYGNITLVGDSDGIVESSGMAMFSRSTPIQVVNFNTKKSETTSYKEYGTNASGYTNGDYGADAAYLGETEDGKVKFMLSGVVGLVDKKEVQVLPVTEVSQVSCYVVSEGKLIHKIMINLTSTSYGSSLNQGPAPSYLSKDKKYYSYDGHYFYEDYAVMLDDYMNETRANSVNPSEPYYNYYQYLPFRSTAVYTGDQLRTILDNSVDAKSKMKNIGNSIVSHQNTYGVNSLIIAGIAANESAWGMSSISQSKNNLFGLDAVDSSPTESADSYTSVYECIRQFAETWMSKGYLRYGDFRYHGGFLGNKASGVNVSYASDPYWGEKAANMAWRFDNKGGNKDAHRYTIGIVNTIATEHDNVNVRNASNTSSTVLYKTGGWTSYAVLLQKNAKENGFYKIQSDAVLNSGRTAIDKSSGKYNIGNMYAYISADYVQIVHKGSDVSAKLPDAGKVETPESKPQEPEDTKTYTKYITTASVNYRSGAGTSAAKKGTIAKGKTIEVEDGYSKKANGYTWYRFKLDGKNYYIASKYVEKYVSLSKPELVSAKYSSEKVTVKWKKVSNAKGYYVYRKEGSGSYKKIKTIKSGSTVSYKDSSSLKEGKKYTYTVKAYAGSSTGEYNSKGISVTIPELKTYTTYKVKTDVNYRSGAGTSKSKKGTLEKGDYIEREDGYSKKANGLTWYRFKLDGKNYYVASKYVEKVKYIKYKTKSKVNYRSGAGTSKAIKGSLKKGEIIKVEKGYSKKKNGYTWYRFKKGSKTYYVASKYLKKQ